MSPFCRLSPAKSEVLDGITIQKHPKTTWAHGTLGFFSPMDAVQLEGFLL
jgi:hypothetical protein